MATRRAIIQRVLRQAYGGIVSDDSMITELLANQYLNDALGYVAKSNYVDSIKIDGISYVNNSFYTTFSGLTITQEDIFTYRVTLPQIPIGIGQNEGVASLRLQSSSQNGNTGKSLDCVPMSMNQVAINGQRRKIPNKYEYWPEGGYLYIQTTGQEINLGYTAIVRMVSGGDSTDLDSQLNIPDDYMGGIIEYFKAQLGFELSRVQDSSNDGADNK